MDFVGDNDATRYALKAAFHEHSRDTGETGVPLDSLPHAGVARTFIEELKVRGWKLEKIVEPSELERLIDEMVTVEEGDTAINPCYYEVRVLGREIWARGGTRADVVPAAEREASVLRLALRARLLGREVG